MRRLFGESVGRERDRREDGRCGVTWRRAAQEKRREGGREGEEDTGGERARPGTRRGREGAHRAAPFSRGSPDVTVALFNYSHAYARRCCIRASEEDARRCASHIFATHTGDSTYAPHYVLCVCPPTRRAITRAYTGDTGIPASR